MKYLIRRLDGRAVAHIWNGKDTICGVVSRINGGPGVLDLNKYEVTENRRAHKLCPACGGIELAKEDAHINRAQSARQLIERVWSYNERRANDLNYELLVLAIPKHPADIEAIASTDIDTICDVLETYVKARRAQTAAVAAHNADFQYGKK